jgi:hypothetical protein
MKAIFTFLLAFLFASVYGQIENRTETNCEGESRTIYGVGDNGLPLIVASKGFDCSICIGQADDVIEFANEHVGQVEVWGAMNFLYSSATPECSDVESWNTTHNWGENIFTFTDDSDFWLNSGTPRYYVIHPTTREVLYDLSSFSTATSIALSIGVTAVNDVLSESSFKVYQTQQGLVIEKDVELEGRLRIFNIVGQEVYSTLLMKNNEVEVLDINLNEGVYISSFYSGLGQLSKKFIYRKQ